MIGGPAAGKTTCGRALTVELDRPAYREQATVERLINRLKQFQRVATRYEKRASNYLAMVTISAIMLWL